MIISHEKKFIFIHNYKVAGSSVTKVLSKYADDSYADARLLNKILYSIGKYPKIYNSEFYGHIKACELKRQIPEAVFNTYYKFGFVRNPWDWQVSLYTYALKVESHHQHQLIKGMKSFEEYIDWRINKEIRFQKDFFYDENGKCLMDFIGKIENLDADFDSICNHIGIQETLPHINISKTGKSYLDYYTPNAIDLVNEAFKADIELFGYAKPQIG